MNWTNKHQNQVFTCDGDEGSDSGDRVFGRFIYTRCDQTIR